MKPEDLEKTDFNSKYEQFEYPARPMGAFNVATVQTLMSQIFHECMGEFFMIYIDDLLTFSRDSEGHYKQVEIVSQCLRANEICASAKKCEL